MDNIDLVLSELAAAKKKHRKFIDTLPPPLPELATYPPPNWGLALVNCRARLRKFKRTKRTHFGAVLECEYYEAMEAYVHGDLDHARQELAQCAAVCIRAMEFVEKEMQSCPAK